MQTLFFPARQWKQVGLGGTPLARWRLSFPQRLLSMWRNTLSIQRHLMVFWRLQAAKCRCWDIHTPNWHNSMFPYSWKQPSIHIPNNFATFSPRITFKFQSKLKIDVHLCCIFIPTDCIVGYALRFCHRTVLNQIFSRQTRTQKNW